MQDKIKLSWNLFFMSDYEVGDITIVYCEPLDRGSEEFFIYNWQDIDRLKALRKEYLPPIFSKNNPTVAQEQLADYSKMLKDKLKFAKINNKIYKEYNNGK